MTTLNHLKNSSQELDSTLEDTGVNIKTSFLKGLRITVVSGGGIAAIEVPRFVRELRRHGAETRVCITANCLKFIGLESLRWASQNEVIQNPTGLSDHICTSDIVVVVPATADLISKISHGICSDGATTFVQSALGGNKTVLFCQTMHDSLSNSPVIQKNMDDLKKIPHVHFISPRKEEGKQKIPDVQTLALEVCHMANKIKNQRKENILITYGGTRVMLDPVRCITNISTGNLGMEVTNLFYGMGYSLTVLAANTTQSLPQLEDIKFNFLPNYQDMFDFCSHIKPDDYQGLIHLVAGSDFIPQKVENSKIQSQLDKLTLILTKAKKLITQTKLNKISYKAAAKLTAGETKAAGLKKAHEFLNENHLDAVFWNTAADAWSGNNNHSGVFIEKAKNKINEITVDHKNEIALCYLNSFQKNQNLRG